jgi:hypothetical protein
LTTERRKSKINILRDKFKTITLNLKEEDVVAEVVLVVNEDPIGETEGEEEAHNAVVVITMLKMKQEKFFIKLLVPFKKMLLSSCSKQFGQAGHVQHQGPRVQTG